MEPDVYTVRVDGFTLLAEGLEGLGYPVLYLPEEAKREVLVQFGPHHGAIP